MYIHSIRPETYQFTRQRQANERFYLEKIAAHNLGVELGLFQNKLFVSTDLFRNHLHKGETSGYANPLDYLGQLFGQTSYGMVHFRWLKSSTVGLKACQL